ncbi:MAG: helix-turn-helix transcriptional regulator [Gammaproteobacteria bacterium]|jgi:transcriptional regulator with XRE-family HTH domain
MFASTALTPQQQWAAGRILNVWLRKKEQLGLRQERAAERAGWSQGMFNHYLHGRKALNIEAVLRLAVILREDPMSLAPEILAPVGDALKSGDGVGETRGSYAAPAQDEMPLLEGYRKLGVTGIKAVMAHLEEIAGK